MKKILAIAIVAIMAVALCVSASAQTSLDRVSVNHNVLQEMGNDVTDGKLTIAKGDKVYILGWAINKDTSSTLKEIVYTLDGTEKKCAANYRNRDDVAGSIGVSTDLGAGAGIGQDDNAFELTGLDKLGDGTYEVEIIAKYNDGTSETLGGDNGKFTLVVGTGVSSGSSTSAAKSVKIELSSESTSGVEAEVKDGKLVCTTTAAGDPWVSIPVEIDTSVYKYFKVTYNTTKEIGSNNTYIKTTGYIGAGDGGDWEPHGMKDTADGNTHSVTYNIVEGFPTFIDQTITGIRLTCCGEEGGVFTVESLEFFAEDPDAQGSNPGTADAAVIAIAAVACIALAGVVVAKKVK